MTFDKSNWTRCGRPREGDVILHPKTKRPVGSVVRVATDGCLVIEYAKGSRWRSYYGSRPVQFIPEHWESLFERGVLVLDRPEEGGK